MLRKFNPVGGVILLAMGSCIIPRGVEGASPTIEWKEQGGITYSPSYIISHRSPAADKARGIEENLVRVKMTAADNCPPLDRWAWYISNVMSGSEIFSDPEPRLESREEDLCTFGVGNGNREVKAKVWDDNVVEAHITDNVSVDNAYLYSIAGSAHDNRTCTMKYYTINNGWAVLPTSSDHIHTCGLPADVTFDALTWGGYDARAHNGSHNGTCPDPDPMTEDHQYCVNGNNPPYGKSNSNDERTYPGITDTAHNESSEFGLHQIILDPNDNISVSCGCSRGTGSNILFHGRTPDPPTLQQTNGCIRMHNDDLEVMTDFFESKHDVLEADFHFSVTAASAM
jgi:hypothetical protein